MHTLVLSILAAAQIGNVGVTKPPVKIQLPVVKAVGFGGTPRMIARGGGGTVGGQEADGWVELSAPAPCVVYCGTYVNGRPAGGMMVNLSSSNPAAAKVQPSTGMIMVPVGETRTTFTVLTSGVSAPTKVTISAWREGSPAQTTTLNVIPPSLMGFTIDQTSLTGGVGAHGTLTFNGTPATAGAVKATMSSSNPAAVKVPATVSLAPGSTAVTFDINTSSVASSTPVTITATYGDRMPAVTLTVKPAVLSKFDGRSVELDGPAPSSGASVNVSSADPSHASVPASVNIPAGAKATTVPITDHNDWSEHDVKITAAYGGVTKSADHYVLKNLKPDLAIREVTLKDRFGNVITHPADAQPYKACVVIELLGMNRLGHCLCPHSTTLGVSYLSPTGTGTSVGHDSDIPVTFMINGHPADGMAYTNNEGAAYWYDPVCIDMPGIPQAGGYTDLTLKVDSTNQSDETNEGNNTHKLRITRQ